MGAFQLDTPVECPLTARPEQARYALVSEEAVLFLIDLPLQDILALSDNPPRIT
jgi:hypothetical protein